MTNGTCAMTAVGAITCYDTICAAEMADVISSMTIEALTGIRSAFDDRIRQIIPFYDHDREIWPDIKAVEIFIRSRERLDMVTEKMPELHNNNEWL